MITSDFSPLPDVGLCFIRFPFFFCTNDVVQSMSQANSSYRNSVGSFSEVPFDFSGK